MQFKLSPAPLLLAAALLAAAPAFADWTLDGSASELSFVTVKAQDVAEVHTFGDISGAVGEDGRARVVVQLASVNTGIPVRDQRMQEMLFHTDMYPTADVTTQLDMDKLEDMTPGTTTRLSSELVLTIGDSKVPVTADLIVSRLSDNRVLVATVKPLIVNAGSVGLADGVEKLREVAGLPSISKAVPVSFVLQFTRS